MSGLLVYAAVLVSVPAAETLVFATAEDVSNSALLCMLSAGKKGADQSRFQSGGWKAVEGTDGRYRHEASPVEIEFPEDDDGIRRICVVHARLATSGEQEAVRETLTEALGVKPLDQSRSTIWMRSGNGQRGIQLFPDHDRAQPQVRLIGAAF